MDPMGTGSIHVEFSGVLEVPWTPQKVVISVKV